MFPDTETSSFFRVMIEALESGNFDLITKNIDDY